jgi:hypothetical protein
VYCTVCFTPIVVYPGLMVTVCDHAAGAPAASSPNRTACEYLLRNASFKLFPPK